MPKFWIITWLLTCSWMLKAHDIHVSVIDINVSGDEVEVVLKTFLDDLQLAVGLVPGEELPEDYTSSDELIKNYVLSTLRFSSGAVDYPLEIKEISASMEAVWITLSMKGYDGAFPGALQVKNSFLTEIYNDQTNLVNLRKDGKTTTVAMDRKKKSTTLKI